MAARASGVPSTPPTSTPCLPACLSAMAAPMAISSLFDRMASISLPASSQLLVRSMPLSRSHMPVCSSTILIPGYFARISLKPAVRTWVELFDSSPSRIVTCPLPPSLSAMYCACRCPASRSLEVTVTTPAGNLPSSGLRLTNTRGIPALVADSIRLRVAAVSTGLTITASTFWLMKLCTWLSCLTTSLRASSNCKEIPSCLAFLLMFSRR